MMIKKKEDSIKKLKKKQRKKAQNNVNINKNKAKVTRFFFFFIGLFVIFQVLLIFVVHEKVICLISQFKLYFSK